LYETKKMARQWIKCGNRCYLLFDQYLFVVIFLYVAIFCYYMSFTQKPGVKRNFWLAKFLTSRHVRMYTVIFYISHTLRKLMIRA